MRKKKMTKAKTLPKPIKSKDLPATFGALENVRSELKSDITSLKLEVGSVRAEVKSVRAEVKSLEKNMNSKFEEMKSTNQRMLALLEEQNSRNRVALDGYSAVYEAQQK